MALEAKDERARLNVAIDSEAIQPTEAIPLVSYADTIERAAPAVVSVYLRVSSRHTMDGGAMVWKISSASSAINCLRHKLLPNQSVRCLESAPE